MALRSSSVVDRRASRSSSSAQGRARSQSTTRARAVQNALDQAWPEPPELPNSGGPRVLPAAGLPGMPPPRWQRRGPSVWEDFSDDSNTKLERALRLGMGSLRLWEKSNLLNLDIGAMRQMPGMRPIRRIEPAPPKLSDDKDSFDEFCTQRPGASGWPVMASMPTLGGLQALANQSDSSRISASVGRVRPRACSSAADKTQDPIFRALRKIVHPALARMEEPRFKNYDEALCRDPWFNITHVYRKEKKLIQNCADAIEDLVDEYVEQLQTPTALLSAKRSPSTTMAALSIALHAMPTSLRNPWCVFYVGGDSTATRALCASIRDAWLEWQVEAHSLSTNPVLEPLPLKRGNYEWIHDSDAPESCLERMGCACSTLAFVMTRYGSVDFEARAKLIAHSLGPGIRAQVGMGSSSFRVTKTSRPLIQAAVHKAQDGTRTAALVFSSGRKVGGDFLTGAPHGHEEEVCARSTLFRSLQAAAKKALALNVKDQAGYNVHIPEDGAVLSQDVEIFRDGAHVGYAPLALEAKLAGIISISPPDRKSLLRHKLKAALQGANEVGAEVLVASDAGLGESCDSATFGQILGETIVRSTPSFEVVLAGSPGFQRAVSRAVSKAAEM